MSGICVPVMWVRDYKRLNFDICTALQTIIICGTKVIVSMCEWWDLLIWSVKNAISIYHIALYALAPKMWFLFREYKVRVAFNMHNVLIYHNETCFKATVMRSYLRCWICLCPVRVQLLHSVISCQHAALTGSFTHLCRINPHLSDNALFPPKSYIVKHTSQ